ncbi:MAG: hypothetical protein ABSC56_05280 [Solirubrobacteraceae bacterium]|jgi:hypothetical protein
MSAWSYIWIVALFKIPTVAFAWLVWRSLRKSNDPTPQSASDGGGGSKLRLDPHPRPRVPRRPRRGPHGAVPAPPPARVRSVNARARVVER